MNNSDQPQGLSFGTQRFHLFFEYNPLMCFIVNADGIVRDVNTLGAEELGYTKVELIGRSVLDVFHPEDKKTVSKHVDDCLQTSDKMHSWELRKVRKNHAVIWVREVGRSIEDTDGTKLVLITCENITAQRHLEEEMKNSKANLSAVIENTRDSIWSVDMECRILTMNTQFREMFFLAYGTQLTTGMAILEHIPNDIRPTWNEFYQRTFQGEHFTVEQHYEFAGISLDTEISFNPIVAADGSITGAAVYSKDITERKNAEKALRESEEKYRSIFENIAEGIYQSTEEGQFITINPSLTKMLGYDSTDEVMMLNLNRDVYANAEDRIILNRETLAMGKSYYVEVNWKKKDGTIFPVRLNDRAVLDTKGIFQYYEVTVEDVSEQRKLEEHLVQSQKIESIGRIAGGVAHDMNNMLAVILPTAEMMKDFSDDAELVKKYSAVISSSARRAADIVKQLLVFSRQTPSQMVLMNLNDLIKETQKMLEHVIGKNITVEILLENGLPMIEADMTQLQQVLINLSVNARDAMSGNGTLLISTRKIRLEGKTISGLENVVPGNYIELKVADTGSGIPEEIVSKVFDAFFSTKGAGQGTGLGLAVVKSIVLKHKGYIDVVSEIANGTTFTIYLPISDSDRPERTVLVSEELPPRGNASILIVDDEEEILKVSKKIFSDLGYYVRTAQSGIKAIEMYRKNRADIVLLDIQMRGIDGRETLRRLREIDPNAKALYITGYARPEILSAIEQGNEAVIIQKPFSIQAMAEAIRKALQE
ncbi:PAS domain S-box protein [bacterium]|nr:MAG: PAS domain S-box protein [bacterium]